MPLELYFHPFASFCQKVLVALYENPTSFLPHFVDLADDKARAEFHAIWPVGKMPVLRDGARHVVLPESTIIIEYLAHNYPGRTQLVPADPDDALRTRLWDRFYDLYVAEPMQRIVTDRLRPPGANDPHGVQSARALLRTAYRIVDREMASRRWAIGDAFTMADCAAAPALFYANWVEPLDKALPHATTYLDRLLARPSFARVVQEARPYRALFPQDPEPA